MVVVEGEAPDALADLPEPDSVFVGGSGGKLAEILKCAVSRIREHGRIVVNLAAMERVAQTQVCLESLGFEVDITMISASRGRALPDGTMRLAAENPVFIVTGANMDAQDRQDG